MVLTACLLILLHGAALAGGAASGEELAEKVQAAISTQDAEAASALYHWEGVPPMIAEQLKDAVEFMVQEPVLRVEVDALPDDFPTVQEMGEQTFVQNVDLKGVVVLVYSEDGSMTGTMPYGTAKDGNYYFSAPVPE